MIENWGLLSIKTAFCSLLGKVMWRVGRWSQFISNQGCPGEESTSVGGDPGRKPTGLVWNYQRKKVN